ncbi:MAG: hypothetical protein ACO1RT_19965 [Planctomycetaceae bacterium]
MNILALGLRRSGTTAFWEIFNRMENFVAYDEPFNTMLRDLPKVHFKGTWGPFVDLYQQDLESFRRNYCPIEKDQELRPSVTAGQLQYLSFLNRSSQHVFIDSTRLLLKTAGLPDAEETLIIHLFRSPIGFVSSHMLPSYGGMRSKFNRQLNQLFFWSRSRGFDTWSIERILTNFYHEET